MRITILKDRKTVSSEIDHTLFTYESEDVLRWSLDRQMDCFIVVSGVDATEYIIIVPVIRMLFIA